jgi:hypothetical protein
MVVGRCLRVLGVGLVVGTAISGWWHNVAFETWVLAGPAAVALLFVGLIAAGRFRGLGSWSAAYRIALVPCAELADFAPVGGTQTLLLMTAGKLLTGVGYAVAADWQVCSVGSAVSEN